MADDDGDRRRGREEEWILMIMMPSLLARISLLLLRALPLPMSTLIPSPTHRSLPSDFKSML
eukprot:739309-Pyramimonas_sp.AAC.1